MIKAVDSKVQLTMRSNKSPQWVNEKYSMLSKNVWCINIQKRVYLMNEKMPIVLNDGWIISNMSRGMYSFKMEGRTNANKTQADACMPGVSENISTNNPKKNAHNINSLRLVFDSNESIK
jgi:hypothetical protein